MGVFIVMYLLLFLVWLLSGAIPKNKRNLIVCILCFFLLWFIQAFRDYSIGVDLKGYIPFFRTAGSWGYKKDLIEPGYTYFTIFIRRNISSNPTVFLAFVSAAILIPVSLIFKKYSKLPVLSFIIYASFIIYIFSFSGLRQTMAIGITTLSYIFIEKKKILPFIGLVFLATLFHSSAIIFIITYPLCNYLNTTKRKYFISFCIGLISLLSLRNILNYIIPFIFQDSQERYMEYYAGNIRAAYNLAILIFIFFLATFLVKNPTRTDLNMRMILFISFWCQCLGLISPVVPRIGFYFIVFLGVALANVTEELPVNKTRRLVASICLAVFMIGFFFTKYSSGYLNVIPYKFIWE